MSIAFGVNQNHYDDMSPYVKPITIERTYKSLQPTWPEMQVPGTPSVWSIRPDPAKLFKGQYDAEIKSALLTAPAGSYLTSYHEASLAGISYNTAVKVQQYLHRLVHSVTDKVPFGNITLPGDAPHWDAPGMDWYGLDVYDFHANNNAVRALNYWYYHGSIRTTAPTLITETNTNIVANRSSWFTQIYEWLASSPPGWALCTFWNPGGHWSGPWLPNDTATINTLNQIAAEAASLRKAETAGLSQGSLKNPPAYDDYVGVASESV